MPTPVSADRRPPAQALRALGQKLARESAGRAAAHTSLLSHVHWDHIRALPFSSPRTSPGTHIHVYALLTAADELQEVIGGITRRVLPVPLELVPARFQFNEVGRARRYHGGFTVLADSR